MHRERGFRVREGWSAESGNVQDVTGCLLRLLRPALWTGGGREG